MFKSTRHGQKVTVLSVVLAIGSNACPDKCVLALSTESGVGLSDRSVDCDICDLVGF